jgi:hypothetical protein
LIADRHFTGRVVPGLNTVTLDARAALIEPKEILPCRPPRSR